MIEGNLPVRTAQDRPSREKMTLYQALAAGGMTVGSIVQSMAGHDYGRLAVIIAIRPPFAHIMDGSHRPASKPKIKRLTHLRLVAQTGNEELNHALLLPDEGQRNSAIRRLIQRCLETLTAVASGTTPAAPDQNP